MKILYLLSTTLLILSPLAFADKMLTPPNDQAPECLQAYHSSPQPKTASQVYSALNPICLRRGGSRVLHKMIFLENTNEPKNVMFTCIGDNPNKKIFSCYFSESFEDL